MNDSVKGIRITDIPSNFFESATKRIIDYLIGIVRIIGNEPKEDAILIGSGTLVDINGTFGILTAQHVIDELPRHGNLGLIISEQVHRPTIDANVLIYSRMGRGRDPSTGPDLGFIKLPNSIISILKAYKSFYNVTKSRNRVLDNPPADDLGLWYLRVEYPMKRLSLMVLQRVLRL
jgi:hypothetical protein